MDNNNMIAYLISKNVLHSIVSCEPITIGASGSKLYVIDAGNQKYVLKNVPKSLYHDKSMIHSYKKELSFYEL